MVRGILSRDQVVAQRPAGLIWRIWPLLLTMLVFGGRAYAVPSFASQTGLPCQQCHTVAYGPALTEYGRQFKLNGYVFGQGKDPFPLALMLQGGYSRTKADQPDVAAPNYKVNNNVELSQVSLFVASRLTSHLGLFAQITYDGIGHAINWDNLDLRYARTFNVGDNALVAGFSVNNNPTVQDLWNSTPAWGFPYISSALVPTPAAAPVIAGGLAQTVLGATAYVSVNNRYYVEAGAYRGLSANWLDKTGVGRDASPNLSGLSPYWRAAVQFSEGPSSYSVGAFGLDTKVQADPTQPLKDHSTDFGFDATYQYNAKGPHVFAVNASLIHERQELAESFAAGGSDAASNSLETASVDLTYSYRRTWVGAVNAFSTSGTTNNALYNTAEAMNGSASGSPDSSGYVLQAEYVPYGKLDSYARPWLNLRLGLQYTGYTKFNGGSSNYDGLGRNASDNNTMFAFFWVIL
ncbi:MAG: hypothetical protein RL684_37 [Pseudomonadota bacterium]